MYFLKYSFFFTMKAKKLANAYKIKPCNDTERKRQTPSDKSTNNVYLKTN